ncbi:YhzD family protein [Camelliibacillus cellulosilyticus]|uniref:YhzD family protein n=1 Tax=Camelliibacillus cellulosilyticus TaxID=2174486 RepID=A0ABV9GLQ2_9BACL
MPKYTLTVYDKDGTKLLEETFEAESDQDGRKIGEEKLKEKNYETYTSRVTSSTGKLVHFHR